MCVLISESMRGIERRRERERQKGVMCKHSNNCLFTAEGVGTMLLFQGRVVSDCDSPSSLSFFLARPPSCLFPLISSPQREKRWSISSAGGEKNSSSVSRGDLAEREQRQKERDEMGWKGRVCVRVCVWGARRHGGRQRWRKGKG